MDTSFQRIVLITAIIIFIIFIIIIGVILYKNKYSAVFPPVVSSCPDYWIDKQNINMNDPSNPSVYTTGKQSCFNIKNLGNTSCSKEMDFSENYWQGSLGLERKYKWAQECNLTWDGITNNPAILTKSR